MWLESADGTQFVDTLMVTNAVAIHGIGNRPGTWNMLSGPRFPYGRRPMALPIWAHARGELYPFVAMNDGMEDELGYHENTSSPEPYFCRPMALGEIVDAVTCPSGQFRSAKGLLDATQPQSYYPPRADLFNFGGTPCIARIGYPGSCDPGDSAQYFALDDVDLVAAATPPYGAPYTGSWIVPADLASGDYALAVEVAKEFDTNAANSYPSEVSALDMEYYGADGQHGNVGQPSVLFRVPFTLRKRRRRRLGQRHRRIRRLERGDRGRDAARRHDQHRPRQRGGAAVALRQRDERPGAGVAHARGLLLDRLHGHAGAGSAPRLFHRRRDVERTRRDASGPPVERKGGEPVVGYDVRYAILPASGTIDPSAFSAWTPTGGLAVGPPGTSTTVQIGGLTPRRSTAWG